jgi:hypothetical protein
MMAGQVRLRPSPYGYPIGVEDNQSSSHSIVAVFQNEAQAERVAADLASAGIGRDAVRIGDERDHITSLRSEMRHELNRSAPTHRAGAFAVVAGTIIGALVGLPFALIPMDDLSWWARVLLTCGIGALAGAAIGFVAGGSLAMRGPGDELAAQRGVTLTVVGDIDTARPLILAQRPLRLDVVDASHLPVEVVPDDDEPPEPLGRLQQNVRADDYRRGQS